MKKPTIRHEWGSEIMQWIAENWVLLLVAGGMIAMHLFGHGHGGHGGHGKHKRKQAPKNDGAADPSSHDER